MEECGVFNVYSTSIKPYIIYSVCFLKSVYYELNIYFKNLFFYVYGPLPSCVELQMFVNNNYFWNP